MEKASPIPIDITDYQPSGADDRITNPLLKEVRELMDRFAGSGQAKVRTFLSMERQSLIGQYAFAIPTSDILATVARYSPLVEIGAGSGYWAMCLSSIGADIVAYDIFPPGGDPFNISQRNWQFRKSYFDILKGNDSAVASHPDRTLFLCWPPPENPMGSRALDAYIRAGGHTVIVIGQMNKPVIMGDAKLFEMLKELEVIERRFIHGWPGFNEEIVICKCR
jgi:hypothetical protein